MKQLIISSASTEGYILDGIKIWLVRVFAYIQEIVCDSSCMRFAVFDGSGNIDAILWIDNKEKENQATHIR